MGGARVLVDLGVRIEDGDLDGEIARQLGTQEKA
jgi:hypothetical protein